MKKNALVTGGAGFIGSHLCQKLLETGWNVRVIDDLSTGSRDNLPETVRFFHGDICDAKILAAAMDGCDTIFHLAARMELQQTIEDPADCYQSNIVGTAQVVRQMLDQKDAFVIFASSCAVYPLHPEGRLSEDMATDGDTPYSISKLNGERTLHAYRELKGLNYCSLRCFNVYGPGQRADTAYASVIPLFLRQALAGRPMTVCGSGEQTRDFIHVDDVIRAYLLAATKRIHGIFNIATGEGRSINQLAQTISALVENGRIDFLPARPGDASSSVADTTRASQQLGFSTSINFTEGIRSYFEHIKDTEFRH